ncbi:MAG: acetyl-CoA decarbonylase/synthase complex subunit gamma [Dehalococcoidales bacterium]
MPLTGIEIFKLLPKTNCGECGVPTCLAFAMSLAAGKADLSACPYVSDEAKEKLSEASAPPIATVTIGAGEKAVKVGGETVMFRHEKRFENPTGIAILISDNMDEAEVDQRIEKSRLSYERVGLTLRPELIALKCDSGDSAVFAALVQKVKESSQSALILASFEPAVLRAGLEVCADQRPLVYAATRDNLEDVADLVKEYSCPVAIKADGLEELSQLTSKVTEKGIKDVVIDSGASTVRKTLEDQVGMRSIALNKKFRPLGFPTIIFPGQITQDPMKEGLIASIFVAKYAGIIVLSDFHEESLFPLLVERMNIFTDPQRPLATTEGIYEVGGPDENSPVVLTCNFSLTYFIVSGEIENSRVPSYLLVMDTEGLSVLTAWAAGKFSADVIGAFVKKCGIGDRVKHKKLIIPGYIAIESGGLEEELPGWEIQIGPREGAHIPAYLKGWQ